MNGWNGLCRVWYDVVLIATRRREALFAAPSAEAGAIGAPRVVPNSNHPVSTPVKTERRIVIDSESSVWHNTRL
jgi:hypothetical protein